MFSSTTENPTGSTHHITTKLPVVYGETAPPLRLLEIPQILEQPSGVKKMYLRCPVDILSWNVTGHMASTDMQGDIYITVGEGF